MLGDTCFMGTVDAHLLAIDAKSGQLLWDTVVAMPAAQYSITMPPLVVKDKVIIGTAGGDLGIRGFIAALSTRRQARRPGASTPSPGRARPATTPGRGFVEEGRRGHLEPAPTMPTPTWCSSAPAIPRPTGTAAARLGDNLYSDSVVALDADTGKLKWHYQFTPHDELDYDSTQVPVLADIAGAARRAR